MNRLSLAIVISSALAGGLAHAQNAAPGGGAVSNPANPSINAAAGAKPAQDPATTGSGSGTSTSGGKDANGDGGRDKMPNSNMEVKSLREQGKN